ncbi:apical membrane antigen 1-like protein [Cyclospora cayetanensis]|uniref:Apical membrane antigen 1-like protein n=1 Tax=Cyclospora cayetanensis TaxID=88456 RepID=A0A6P6RYM6_9EIME|nr:apical membrane antigen 1-like protein [Cyclospora cayetanensis]
MAAAPSASIFFSRAVVLLMLVVLVRMVHCERTAATGGKRKQRPEGIRGIRQTKARALRSFHSSSVFLASTMAVDGVAVNRVAEASAEASAGASDISGPRKRNISHATFLVPLNPYASAFNEQGSGANPWLSGELKVFIDRFNVPVVHRSGVFVDLGMSNMGYRQVSGDCPVYGKYIKLSKTGSSTLSFLENYPAGGSSTRPLPGGFNLSYSTSSGKAVSPVTDSFLKSVFGSEGPQTPIGRCAKYANLTEPMKPGTNTPLNYRLPFVYNITTQNCYVLHVSMQKLTGSRYCSTNGSPSGLVWPCFSPERSASTSASLVYGSGYMGRDANNPDGWTTKCPYMSVKDALFGAWGNGKCEEIGASTPGVIAVSVSTKQHCWEQVFMHSATDETTADNPANWNSVWPTFDSSATASGGVGYNYANFYANANGSGMCVIFQTVPTCFLRSSGNTAYNALGSLDEEVLPGSAPGGGGEGGGNGGDEKSEKGGSK